MDEKPKPPFSRRRPTPSAPPPADGPDARIYEDERRMAYGLRIFEKYNRYKIRFLREELTVRRRAFYDLAPLMLHMDPSSLLGDVCAGAPHGITDYSPNQDTEEAFREIFPGRPFPKLVSQRVSPDQPIRSLSLIGSLGSVAQNNKSDFDYWVVLDPALSPDDRARLVRKLNRIQEWAREFADAEVYFYPLDHYQIRAEAFGETRGDHAGTSMGKLLKEEYYRTMTLVAGQMPIWWAMPSGVGDAEYERLTEVARRSYRLNWTALVDLGNVTRIDSEFFLGAAIWHLNKTIGSPFKSVMKLALLEDYLNLRSAKPPLCDDLKHHLLSDHNEVQFWDPYVLMYERIENHFKPHNRTEDLNLIRRAMYLKTGARLTLADHRRRDLSRKKRVMAELVRSWGWGHGIVDHLNEYHQWSFQEAQAFSESINAFVFSTFQRISGRLSLQKKRIKVAISQRDLRVLSRKLAVFYTRWPGKIQSSRSVIEAPPPLPGLTLQLSVDDSGQRVWSAYRGLLSRQKTAASEASGLLLQQSAHLAEICIWLVSNRIVSPATSINLNPPLNNGSTYVSVPDMQHLIRSVRSFFPFYKHIELDEDSLLQDPINTRVCLILNLEESDGVRDVMYAGVCYQNNWGELFFKASEEPRTALEFARDFLRHNFEFDREGRLKNFRTFVPERQEARHIAPFVNQYLGLPVLP